MLTKFQEALIKGDAELAKTEAVAAIERGEDAVDLLNEQVKPAMEIIGDKFEKHEYFLPHLVLGGEALKSAMTVLEEALPKDASISLGTVVIGTVEGDIHDIGKNIVAAFLTSSGFNVIDLGTEVSVFDFIKAAKEAEADIIAVSALMSHTMTVQQELVSTLEAMGIRENYKIVIGGAPTSATWAEEIGANAYGSNVQDSVKVCKRMMEE